MTAAGIGQIILYAIVLIALGVPLGAYMARVYTGNARVAQRVLGPIERGLYRLFGIKADQEQSWKQYAVAVMLFNVLGMVAEFESDLIRMRTREGMAVAKAKGAAKRKAAETICSPAEATCAVARRR